jgi:hypothetical protein
MKYLGLLLMVTVLALAGPFLTIWSLNTLFSTGIEYGFQSWFAAFTLIALFSLSRSS